MDKQERHSAGNPQTRIDIKSIVKEMERRMRAVDSRSSNARGHGPPECLISKVNSQTRLVDPSEYDPYSVHIGSYHHDRLHQTEPAKWEILRRLLPEAEEERNANLSRWLTEIAGLDERARGHYADSAERMASDEDFAQMLLLDGCYILHCFVFRDRNRASARGSASTSSGSGSASGDTATGLSQSWRALDYIAVVRDVFYLLENQIPFFVLEKIHELIDGQQDGGSVVFNAVMSHIQNLLREQEYSIVDVAASPRPCHLVHLLHMHFRPSAQINGGQGDRGDGAIATASSPTTNVNGSDTNATGGNLHPPNQGETSVHRWRLATQYEIAGVKFQSRPLDAHEQALCVLDVELKGRTLRVPSLMVDNNTWRILRNLMALEQHNPQLGSHVTAYCLFMSQVAGTEKDVELLAKKKIIVHLLGSDSDVAEGFANLCKGVAIDMLDPARNYLSETMKNLDGRYRSRRHNWIAWLRRRHLSNPWLVIALVAAIIGFSCQVIQTVYAILGYRSR